MLHMYHISYKEKDLLIMETGGLGEETKKVIKKNFSKKI